MRLDRLTQALPGLGGHGLVSVVVGPVRGEPWLAREADAPHYAASTMKLAVAMAAFRRADRGELDLDHAIEVRPRFASAAGGAPYSVARARDNDPEVWRREGQHVALRWLTHRALTVSSNLAANLVLAQVGVDEVTALLADLGCHDSRVTRGIEDADAIAAGLDNVVTARDLARQLCLLATGGALGPAATREVLDVLRAQQVRDGIPRGLPPGTPVAHKTGWVDGVSHDAALVWPAGTDADPVALVVCTTTPLAETAASRLIADLARLAWADLTES